MRIRLRSKSWQAFEITCLYPLKIINKWYTLDKIAIINQLKRMGENVNLIQGIF